MPAMWRKICRRSALAPTVAAVAALLTSNAALGDGAIPNFRMIWDVSNDSQSPFEYDAAQFGQPVQEGSAWRYQGYNTGLFDDNESWEVNWNCLVNPDPFVNATLTITNNSNSAQVFDMYMVLVLGGPVLPVSVMNGSVSLAINNFQSGFTSASVSDAGEPIYQAFIDPIPQGTPGPPAATAVRTLWDPPSSFVVPVGQGSGSFPTRSFSNEIGPGALTAIAIRLRITLSGRDTAIISGIFEINEIPGPATLAVFGAVLAVTGSRRRRR